MKAPRSFETSRHIKLPATRRNIPEDQNTQHKHSETLEWRNATQTKRSQAA
jgi:hypothetical protein